jgi:hypothetical protein
MPPEWDVGAQVRPGYEVIIGKGRGNGKLKNGKEMLDNFPCQCYALV